MISCVEFEPDVSVVCECQFACEFQFGVGCEMYVLTLELNVHMLEFQFCEE